MSDSSDDHTIHAGLSSRRFEKGSQKSNNLQRIRSADRLCSDLTNKDMNASMSSPGMPKPSAPNRKFSSTTITQQRAEKPASGIRPERSVLDGLLNINDTEIEGTPSRSASPILRTPEKSFRGMNTCLSSMSRDGVKRSERIAARYKSKVVFLFFLRTCLGTCFTRHLFHFLLLLSSFASTLLLSNVK